MFLQHRSPKLPGTICTTLPITKQRDMLSFAVDSWGDYYCDKDYFVKRSDLNQCYLMYTFSGIGSIEYMGRKHLLLPGHVFLIDCRNYQYYRTEEEPWHFFWVHLEGKASFDYVKIYNANEIYPLNLKSNNLIPNYLNSLAQFTDHFNLQNEREMSLLTHKILFELISIKESSTFSKKHGGYQKIMDEITNYIRGHFNETLTLERLADICHLSKYYFIKVFKSYTGQTPYDYILTCRLQQAQQLLINTSKTVYTIAQETGFSDDKAFIECFKKHFNQTPLQFRKQKVSDSNNHW